MTENELGTIIVEAAIAVHRELGVRLNFVGEIRPECGFRA